MTGFLFGVGSAVIRHWPAWLRYGGATLVGRINYVLRPHLRRQTLANYAAVMGQPPSSPRVRQVARDAMVGYTKLLADFLLLPGLRPEQVRRMVEVSGIENIRTALGQGRGAIVVTPHFGNWDLAAAAAVVHGVRLTVVAEHFGTRSLNAKVVESRARMGVRVVPVGVNAGKAALAALRRNEVVALVCDLPKEGRNIAVHMLGQLAMVPAGPALLSLREGAPVVPITCRRLPDDRYHLAVEAPVSFQPSGDVERDLPRLAQAIIDRFENTLRSMLEQWYLFSPMWGLAEPPASGLPAAVMASR